MSESVRKDTKQVVSPHPRYDVRTENNTESVGRVAFDPDEVLGDDGDDSLDYGKQPSVPVDVKNDWIATVPRGAKRWEPLTVPVSGPNTDIVTSIVGFHPLRRSLTIYNAGTVAVWIGSKKEITTSGMNSFQLPVGASHTIEYQGPVFATTAAPGTSPGLLSISALYEDG